MMRNPANISLREVRNRLTSRGTGKLARGAAIVAVIPALVSGGAPGGSTFVEDTPELRPDVSLADLRPSVAENQIPVETQGESQIAATASTEDAPGGDLLLASAPPVATAATELPDPDYVPTQSAEPANIALTRETDPRRGPNTTPILDAEGPVLYDGPQGQTGLDKAWRPIQTMTGLLIPRETNLWQDQDGRLSFNVQPGLPFLTDIEAQRLPEFKAGPFSLDILWLGATAIYSDLETTTEYPDDGFAASIDMKFQAAVRVADGVNLSAAASLYYLPEEGKLGFYFFDRDYSFARLSYEGAISDWNFQIYDEFQALHRLTDMLDPVESNEIDYSGRYRLGRIDQAGLGLDEYDQDELLLFRNTLGARVMRPLGNDFRFWADFDHYDYWETLDFEDHRQAARLRAQIFWEKDWRFNPYVGYTALTPNGYDGFSHEVYTGSILWITPRLRAHGRIGYLWQDEINGPERDDGLTWKVGLTYDQNEYLRHMLDAGRMHWLSDFGEEYLSTYARYALQCRFPFDPVRGSFGRLSTAGMYLQWGDTEYWDQPATEIESIQVGANLTVPIGNQTRLALSAAYRTDDTDDPIEAERLIYRASLLWNLGLRTSCTLAFQHEDISRLNANLKEDMLLLQVRRAF